MEFFMKNFNVVTDPWMPVLDMNGNFNIISPIELFSSNNYESFAGSEVENYVLMLFCEALVHSSTNCQPKNNSEWRNLKSIIAKETIDYMNKHIDLFWMRGDKPFLQSKESEFLETEKYKPIQLREKYTIGNNALINTNTITNYKDFSEIILDLLVHQVFSVTFGKAKAIPSRWLMYKKDKNGNFNFYVTGSNLIESIWLNLAIKDGDNFNFGIPVWENGFNSDTSTYLSQLIPLSVKIYISDDLTTMKYEKGLTYPEYSNTSHIFIVNNKEEIRPLSIDKDMKFWKEFNSIIKGNYIPIQLNKSRFKGIDTITIHGIGGQYKESMGIYSTIKLISSYYQIKNPDKIYSDNFLKMYSKCIDKTNSIANNFIKAIEKSNYKSKKEKELLKKIDISYIKELFWKHIDAKSFELFQYNDETDCEKWNTILKNIVNDTLNDIAIKYGYLISYQIENKFLY
jgi:hypothetical protein